MPTPEEQARYDELDKRKEEQEKGATSPLDKFKSIWPKKSRKKMKAKKGTGIEP